MAIKTYEAQVEELDAAITRVLGGQSYSIGGKTFQRADLDVLQKMRADAYANYLKFEAPPAARRSLTLTRGEYSGQA